MIISKAFGITTKTSETDFLGIWEFLKHQILLELYIYYRMFFFLRNYLSSLSANSEDRTKQHTIVMAMPFLSSIVFSSFLYGLVLCCCIF